MRTCAPSDAHLSSLRRSSVYLHYRDSPRHELGLRQPFSGKSLCGIVPSRRHRQVSARPQQGRSGLFSESEILFPARILIRAGLEFTHRNFQQRRKECLRRAGLRALHCARGMIPLDPLLLPRFGGGYVSLETYRGNHAVTMAAQSRCDQACQQLYADSICRPWA